MAAPGCRPYGEPFVKALAGGELLGGAAIDMPGLFCIDAGCDGSPTIISILATLCRSPIPAALTFCSVFRTTLVSRSISFMSYYHASALNSGKAKSCRKAQEHLFC